MNTLKIGTCQMFILPGQNARMCNDSEAVAALVYIQANGLLLMNLHRSERQDCRTAELLALIRFILKQHDLLEVLNTCTR